ncbi:hypothetical protein [Streptomyces inhibens]|nr:hypothetical protein [Streptomyces inhibens]
MTERCSWPVERAVDVVRVEASRQAGLALAAQRHALSGLGEE